jgi:hypothetical protein
VCRSPRTAPGSIRSGRSPAAAAGDLAAILAQFRRGNLQVQHLVHRRLARPRQTLAGALSIVGVDLAHVERAVLVQRHVPIEGVVPQRDVVALAPREVLQRGAVLLGRDRPEVDAHVPHPEASLRLAGLDHVVGAVPVGERLDDRHRLLGRDQYVDIADRRTPPAQGSRGLAAVDRGMLPQMFEHGLRQRAGVPEQLPLACLPGELDPLQDVRLRLRAEAGPLPDLPRLGGGRQIAQGLDPQFAVQRPDGLRPDPLDAGHRVDFGGHLRAQLVQFLDLAGLDPLGEFARDGVADVVQFGQAVQAVGRRDLGQRRRVAGHGLRRPAVRPRLVLDIGRLQSVRELLQERGEFVVGPHSERPPP